MLPLCHVPLLFQSLLFHFLCILLSLFSLFSRVPGIHSFLHVIFLDISVQPERQEAQEASHYVTSLYVCQGPGGFPVLPGHASLTSTSPVELS